jgi:hypothetical protein
MMTGALRPAGAHKAGQEAIAEASDAQDAKMARFSEMDSEGCGQNVLGVIEDRPGMLKITGLNRDISIQSQLCQAGYGGVVPSG